MLRQALKLWKRARFKKETSLQKRLIIFFAFVTIFIIAGFSGVLVMLDTTGNGQKIVYTYTKNELLHVGEGVTNQLGKLSYQGVELAQKLSSAADEFIEQNHISIEQIQSETAYIEQLLSKEAKILISEMEHSVCGGIYMLLDATVNPQAPDAQTRRAGIFLKKTQPNTVQSMTTKMHYLRGPAQVARENSIELMGQWKMEFDIENEPFFVRVMENARSHQQLKLSRLYYWSDAVLLKGNSEAGILLCVPLRTKDQKVFGVAGFEVSKRMFKELFSPTNSAYEKVFTTLSRTSGSKLLTSKGLSAGNLYLTGTKGESDYTVQPGDHGFYRYESEKEGFGGFHQTIDVYSEGSVYENEPWIVSIMMPDKVLQKAIRGNTPYLLLLIILLLVCSLGGSVFISRRYLRPLTQALDTIKKKDYHSPVLNKYVEINDLMEFLSKQDEQNPKNMKEIAPLFDEFLVKIQTLSKAERNVFNLYMEGYNAQEIADQLFVSINTIKTHNKRIFSKLDISSRKELLVYTDMMREMGML